MIHKNYIATHIIIETMLPVMTLTIVPEELSDAVELRVSATSSELSVVIVISVTRSVMPVAPSSCLSVVISYVEIVSDRVIGAVAVVMVSTSAACFSNCVDVSPCAVKSNIDDCSLVVKSVKASVVVWI